MRLSNPLLLASFGVLFVAASCTLITDVDRSKIPDGVAGAPGSGNTGGDGSNAQAGSPDTGGTNAMPQAGSDMGGSGNVTPNGGAAGDMSMGGMAQGGVPSMAGAPADVAGAGVGGI